MKILVIGSGGREHALVWAMSKSPRLSELGSELICAPGNGGIASLARCSPVDVSSVPAMIALVQSEQPALVVIGPEVPLAAGIVDALHTLGIPVFGPTQAAAQLESSKAFAKHFMQRWLIPTARYTVCKSLAEVATALAAFPPQVVLKADGLAAGKGVILCQSHAEAAATAAQLLNGTLLGTAAESIVLEETLTGPEISYFALCDGEHAVTLAFAQDHKRIGEGDTGPNTGGMGAYSTENLVTPEMAEWMRTHIAQRVVDGMKAEGAPFVGVLFTGFMMTPAGPMVLEFNTRFGDPETEAILMRLETDLVELILASVEGRGLSIPVRLKPGASACVIAASAGYPGPHTQGRPISGLDDVPSSVQVFHAGTAFKEDELVTAGGRVLAVTAVGTDLATALQQVYAALDVIAFEGMQFRRDIGWRALAER